jgi:phage replication O-like protein O
VSNFIVNSFQIPNAIVDIAFRELSGNAIKIYLVIARKTRGWGKDFDRISLTQFVKISGMSRPTVVSAIKELLDYKLIVEDQDYYINSYALDDSNIVEAIDENIPKDDTNQLKNLTSKEIKLVKNFTPTGKESLPQTPQTSKESLHTEIKIKETKTKVKEHSESTSLTQKTDSFNFKAELLELGCEEQHVDDWILLRKSKKSANTKTALTGFLNQVKQANITPQQAVQHCAESSWAGFKSDWYANATAQKVNSGAWDFSQYKTPKPNMRTVKGDIPKSIGAITHAN